MRASRRWVGIAVVVGVLAGSASPVFGQEASQEPMVVADASPEPLASAAPSGQPSAGDLVEIYPVDIGAGPVSGDDLVVLHGQEIVTYVLGPDPDPMDVVALETFAEATGHSLDDMTQVWGWHRFPDGLVSLAGIQLPGADTAVLSDAALAWGLEMMWHPEVEVSEIAGKDVTVFHTEESLGEANFLYANGDIAWVFTAPEAYVEVVLEHLPG